DRTVVFDCPYDVARQRLAATGRRLDRFEREDRQFFERVRAAYLARAAEEPGRIRIVDASLTPTEIQEKLEDTILLV
ncbi:MAG: dTMP kinase, partial [Burkholderiales bacterium]